MFRWAHAFVSSHIRQLVIFMFVNSVSSGCLLGDGLLPSLKLLLIEQVVVLEHVQILVKLIDERHGRRDVVFEDLYNKYKTKMEVAPEVKLIMMIGGSAMMYHLTNSMFKAAIPNMNDVLKQNPDLVKNMVDAVKNTNQGGAPSMPSVSQQQQEPSFDSSGRREMKGPGIDLTSLMGGMMPPPPPVNTSQKTNTLSPVEEESDDDISDIISISGESTGGEVRDVTVTAPKRSRRRTKKKTEISI